MAAALEDVARLAAGLARGNRRALARAITIAESTRADHRLLAEELLGAVLPAAGNALRLGISGAPGVGKSTFIEAFGLLALARGRRVAVLAVDPTSKRGGGSILGDKTRMPDLARSERAFIRPSPAGRTLGGVARRTREAIWLAEAAGFDLVIVETVGVGQSETAVADMVDLFLLLIAPGGGDELQGIKRGIIEHADLVLVTKADGDLAPAARRGVADYRHALHLLRPAADVPEVLAISALEGRGVDKVLAMVESRAAALEASGATARRRQDQARAALWSEIDDGLLEALKSDPDVAAQLPALEAKVAQRALTPSAAARAALAAFLARGPSA
ncbi:MAG TPA: methylmalonyl Co-A mutase-associated GTPase MeaB [Stellaceae bacterium]|nr:methylmalonyl Co-A mutase-associated GTPase MeaB [Stellaceae bacterium]